MNVPKVINLRDTDGTRRELAGLQGAIRHMDSQAGRLLAALNHQLIRDEGHRNPMTEAQLARRMRGWLARGEYRAELFEEHGEVVAALAARDPERAERAIRRHVEAAAAALMAAMRREP